MNTKIDKRQAIFTACRDRLRMRYWGLNKPPRIYAFYLRIA